MSVYFDAYLKVAPFSHALWRASEAEVISQFEIKSPVLDIGCGFGEFSGIFFNSTVDIGIDKSERDCDIAKKGGVYKDLLLADATHLPIESSSIGTCISISTLEHIQNADKVILEAYRVLVSGGVFILTLPTEDINRSLFGYKILSTLGLTHLAQQYVRIYHKVFKHITIVSDETWKSWLKEAGFQNITMIPTLSNKHLAVFELFLLSGSVSQLLRGIFGKRMIINTKLRTSLLTRLYRKLNGENHGAHNSSNIVLVATK